MRSPRIPALGVLLVLLTACSLSDEKFQEDYPDQVCTYYQSCDPPYFPDQANCVDEQQQDLPEVDTCTFDKDTAKACLDALSGLQCDGAARNFPTSCAIDAVYDCSGGGATDDTDG